MRSLRERRGEPRLALVQLAGYRVREGELAALGQRMPAQRARGEALAALPGLGLLTLGGLTPPHGEVLYEDPVRADSRRVFYLANQDERSASELFEAFLKPPHAPRRF